MIVKVDFLVNGAVKSTFTAPPYRSTTPCRRA